MPNQLGEDLHELRVLLDHLDQLAGWLREVEALLLDLVTVGARRCGSFMVVQDVTGRCTFLYVRRVEYG